MLEDQGRCEICSICTMLACIMTACPLYSYRMIDLSMHCSHAAEHWLTPSVIPAPSDIATIGCFVAQGRGAAPRHSISVG